MASQQQPFQHNGGRGGRGGPGRGGRGGRGHNYYSNYGAQGRGATGGLQPMPPTSSLQQAAAYPPQFMPPNGYYQQPAYPYYGAQGMYYGGPQGMPPPPQQQQQQQQQQQPQPPVVMAPRERKPLTITDKDGNPINFDKPKPKSSLQAAAATPAPKPIEQSDAGAKMRQAALEKLNMKPKDDDKAVPAKATETPKTVTEEPAKAVIPDKVLSQDKPKVAEKPKSSLAALVAQPPKAKAVVTSDPNKRAVYSKAAVLKLRNISFCTTRPTELPEQEIMKVPARNRGQGGRGGNNRGSGGGEWNRGQSNKNNRRQSGNEWSRGQAPPKNQQQKRGRGKGHQEPLFDGPVAPIAKSENHWRPRKNTSALVVAEKKVKAILNKMTKEKFGRLSKQMLEIPIVSYETLTMMIDSVYDKAIDEPTFGDMYADLCVSLSKSVELDNLVRIIESDEEPPTEDGGAGDPSEEQTSSSHTVYRWSNDVNASDEQVVGPLESIEDCIDAALDEEERNPVEREEMELVVEEVFIRRGIFIKIMKVKPSAETDESPDNKFYTVYFPVGEAQELGQQLSEIFLSEVECKSDASKKNSFKRSLLNKCEEEFNKKDIYDEWTKEKQAYESSKASTSDAERNEKEEDLNFRRIRIKKQMLGNVKFIGQLYKKKLLKERIVRFCVGSLMKLEQIEDKSSKNPEYKDTGDIDLDEEDHEAVCNLFTTIGSVIDTLAAKGFMSVCFSKINQMSTENSLPARSRFMYKDLLELRDNAWVPRRKEEKAKTLDEIRKDVEKEERRQAQQAQQRGSFNSRGGGGRNDFRSNNNRTSINSRPKQAKPSPDEDGFTTVSSKGGGPRSSVSSQSGHGSFTKKQSFGSAPEASTAKKQLTREQMEKTIKNMPSDFIQGGEKELMLAMDELSGSADAGRMIVEKSTDKMMDCKENERKSIFDMLSLLVSKKKLSGDNVREGLKDIIEFIDSVVVDAPLAFTYLGNLLAEMARLQVIDSEYICEQLEKTKSDPNAKAPMKLTESTFRAIKAAGGDNAVQSFANEQALVKLIGESGWKSVLAAI